MESIRFWAMCIALGLVVPRVVQAQEDSKEASSLRDNQATLQSQIALSAKQISRLSLAPLTPIHLQRWLPGESNQLDAQVLVFNEKELIYLKPGDATVQRSGSQNIVAIDVAWGSPEAHQANLLFQEQKYREAVRAAQGALKTGIFRWQQTVLIAEIVDSLWLLGQYRLAGTTFLKLIEEKPPTLLYASAPLAWSSVEFDKATLDAAKEWLDSPNEMAQLLGASWLLSTKRAEAMVVLKSLSQSKSEPLRQLAAAQLWRTFPPTEAVSSSIGEWSTLRDNMPLPIQWGPTLLIAEKMDKSGAPLLAVPEWMRIAILHPDRYDAKKVALESAQKALRQAGHEDEWKRFEQFQRLK